MKTVKKPFITMETKEQWESGMNALKGGQMVEMSEEAYTHFLECVPPKDFCNVSYICGEPYNHNDKGQAIYLCGIERGGKYFAQYGTVRQYANRELFK